MKRYMFADEAGNFDFTRNQGATKYFILCTITMDNCDMGDELMKLRRGMVRDGLSLDGELHATTDAQAVRDRVFGLISGGGLRIDATILEKAKAQPRVRPTDDRFYKYGWFFHLKYVAPRIGLKANDELQVTAASVGTAKKRKTFREAVDDVIDQVVDRNVKWRLAFWPAASDPCLQLADYCTWAIQRKWETKDTRSYKLIAPFVETEFDLWSVGTKLHY
jgi:uncharacterized protein DUF3800